MVTDSFESLAMVADESPYLCFEIGLLYPIRAKHIEKLENLMEAFIVPPRC